MLLNIYMTAKFGILAILLKRLPL